MLRFIVGALLWLALTAPGGAQEIRESYELQVGDVVQISVLEDPGLNQRALIRPDGAITMPLAGTLQAAGRTPEQLQAALRSALARDFIEPPTVTVSLSSLGGAIEDVIRIFVIGQVSRQGPFEVEPPVTALQALALAGGPNPFAAVDRIQIRSRDDGGEVIHLFDYEMIEDGEVPFEDVRLRDGDVIVVPQRGLFE